MTNTTKTQAPESDFCIYDLTVVQIQFYALPFYFILLKAVSELLQFSLANYITKQLVLHFIFIAVSYFRLLAIIANKCTINVTNNSITDKTKAMIDNRK